MRKMKKLLSVVLSVTMLTSAFPIIANAEEKTDTYEKVSLIEQKDNRTENSKTFYTSNGTYATIATTDPICYEDNGKYKDIDNTIIKKDANTLTNTDNGYSVELPKVYDSGDNIVISKDNVSVSLGIIGKGVSSKAKVNNYKSEKADETSLQNQLYNELEISKTESAILYKNVYSNTDIEYQILPNSIKENIIINKAPTDKLSYTYSLKTNGATAILNDDNSVSVISNEEEVFVIPAAYMYDAKDNFSDNIDISLDKITDSEYTLTYNPDMQWLLDKSIEYPVIIDPDVITDANSEAISSTYISSLQKSTNYRNSTSLYVQGSPNEAGTYRASYFKVNSLPEIPDGVMINNATFGVYKLVTGGNETNNILTLSAVTSKDDDTINSIKYNNVDTYLNNDYVDLDTEFIGNSTGMMEFNITDKAVEWYDDSESNHYLALRGTDTTKNYIRFASSKNTSAQKPVITVEYASGTIFSDNVKLHKIDLGYAGTAYINDATGDVTVESYKFDYNGFNSNTVLSMLMGSKVKQTDNFNGKIAFNFDETLKLNDDINGKKAYCQNFSDGSSAYFVNTSGNNYTNYITDEKYEIYTKDESLILKKAPDEDGYSEIKEFESKNGILKKYTSKNSSNDAVYTSLNYKNDDSILSSITDETEAKYSFDYENNKISNIVYTNTRAETSIDHGDEKIPTQLTITPKYNYATDKFESLTTSINNFIIDDIVGSSNNSMVTVNYEFTSNGSPKIITDENGVKTLFEYDDFGRVIKISQKAGDKSKDLYSYDYGKLKTTITDSYGNVVYENFNKDGTISSISNANGYSQFVSKLDKNMTVKSSEISRYSQNYVINGDFESEKDNCFGDSGEIFSPTKFEAYNGSNVCQMNSDIASTGVSVDKVNSTYTASVWVKGSNAKAKLKLINSKDSNSENATVVESEEAEVTENWQQLSCSINSNSEKYIGISIETERKNDTSQSAVYIDCVKLENNIMATDVNIVKNGEFSQNLDDWTIYNAEQTSESGRAPACDKGTLKLNGIINGQAYAYQKISGNFKKGDTLTFGAYSYASNTLPQSPMVDRRPTVSIYASKNNNLTISDLNTLTPIVQKAFPVDCDKWEYLADEFVLDANYGNLYIVISSKYQNGSIYFDGINLVNGKFYVCDYSSDDIMIESTVSQKSANEILNIATNYTEVTQKTDLVGFNNETQPMTLTTKVSKTDDKKQFAKLNVLSVNKDFMEYSSDPLGWTFYYKTDIFKNIIYKADVTEAYDNIVEAVLYDQYGKVYTSKSGKKTDLYQVLYKYNGSLLEKIIMKNRYFSEEQGITEFHYDEWGNLISINNTLLRETDSYNFEYSFNGNLKRISYPNGTEINFKYDNHGNVIYVEDNNDEIKYKYAYLDDGTRYATYDLASGEVIVEQNGVTTEYNINDVKESFHSYSENADNGTNEIVGDFKKTIKSMNENSLIVTNQNLQSSINSDDNQININTKIADYYDDFGRLSKRAYYSVNSNSEIMHAEYQYLDTDSKYYIPTDKYVPMTNVVKTYNEILNNGESNDTDVVCQSNLIRSITYKDSENNRIIEYRFWYDEYANLVSSTVISDTDKEEGIDFIISSKGYEYTNGLVTTEAPLVTKKDDNSVLTNKKYSYDYDELGNLLGVTSQNILGQGTPNVEKLFTYKETAPYLLETASLNENDSNNFVGIDDNGNIESFFGKDFAYSKNNKLSGFVGNIKIKKNRSENKGEYDKDLVELFTDEENNSNEKNVGINVEYTYYPNGLLKSRCINTDENVTVTYKYFWNNEILSLVSINKTYFNNNEEYSETAYVSMLNDNNGIPYGFLYIDPDKNVNEYYYTFDGVGNIMGIIDGNGVLCYLYDYDALGNILTLNIDELNNFENPIWKDQEVSFLDINPLCGKNYLYDEYAKLYVFNDCYYSPELGKITTKNTNIYSYSNIIDCNPYSFCNNNFITKKSTNGLDFKHPINDFNDNSIISKNHIINSFSLK